MANYFLLLGADPQKKGKSPEGQESGEHAHTKSNQMELGELFCEANNLTWVTPATPTLGLKWGHIITDNQCFAFIVLPPSENSEFLAASSISLTNSRELIYFPQQVLSGSNSSPSAPAKSWEHIQCSHGATFKPPPTGQYHLDQRCARALAGPQPVFVPVGTVSPSLWCCREAYIPTICRGLIRARLSKFTHCNPLLTGPRHESMMDLDQKKILKYSLSLRTLGLLPI